MGYRSLRGAEWFKWDLHIHTPESLVHGFKATTDKDLWEKYICDLESLPPEYKVIGINDYLFIDGYRKVLEYKKNGRLTNIDLILPVIEFRIKKFGGNKQLKRINFHVIFSDELGADLIQNQFLNGLTDKYELAPGLAKNFWSGVVTKDSLADLGKKIKESVPSEQLANYGSDLEEGFNNLNIEESKIIRFLNESSYFTGNYLFAIGKTEWSDFPWSDGSIAEKKDIINKSHLVFTAAESYEKFYNAKKSLKQQQVNDLLLDCSDAHYNIESTDKDRIGNCFTWIKADATFNGLKQIVNEPDRVFIGEEPEISTRVNANKTKYINSLSINRVADYKLTEEWFNNDIIPLNPEMVAIIGNKGNGKSALADIIGFLGNTKNHADFSFLNGYKFKKNPSRAQYFNGELEWADGEKDIKNLNANIDEASYEKVKYIPQNFLEKLCNDISQDRFELELRKVIFSHVEESDRLGQGSLEELLNFKSNVINKRMVLLKSDIEELNGQIIEYEKQKSPDFLKSVEEKLKAKEAELAAHRQSKPAEVAEPAKNDTIKNQQQDFYAEIEKLRSELTTVDEAIKTNNESKGKLKIEDTELKNATEALVNFEQQFTNLKNGHRATFSKYGFDVDKLITLKLELDKVNSRRTAIAVEIAAIEKLFDKNNAESLPVKQGKLKASITEVQNKLDEPAKLHQQYIENLKLWTKKEAAIVGAPDQDETIKYYERRKKFLAEELQKELDAKRQSRMDKVKEMFSLKKEQIDLYKGLYKPVTSFINQYGALVKNYPISLDASLKLQDFTDKFFGFINQASKGSFYGKDDGYRRLTGLLNETDINDISGIEKLLNEILYHLETDQRDGYDEEEREIQNQIRKGYYNEFYSFLFGLDYLVPNYELKLDNKSISELSPGERGALLLIFYLILDQDDIPLIIDQPEENLDNQSVYKILVPFIKEAKKRRQIIIVTHNPNLAVVCDAEQIINVKIDKSNKNKVSIESGAIENLMINNKVVDILEGTLPAFNNRDRKYAVTKQQPPATV